MCRILKKNQEIILIYFIKTEYEKDTFPSLIYKTI